MNDIGNGEVIAAKKKLFEKSAYIESKISKVKTIERINYISAQHGLMCLRDFRDWEGTACPCPECIK